MATSARTTSATSAAAFASHASVWRNELDIDWRVGGSMGF
jgi:hypothetical protein